MKRNLFVLIIILIIVSGCCKKELFSPVVDLKPYEPIGIIQFTSNVEGELDKLATIKFMEYMREDQHGIRLVELGDMNDILNENKSLNHELIKSVGQKYGLKALLIGELEISDVKPDIKIDIFNPKFSAKAEVDARLFCKLYDTEMGANIWSSSGKYKTNVGNVSFSKTNIKFDASDPEKAYGKLIHSLTRYVSRDFRNTYRCK